MLFDSGFRQIRLTLKRKSMVQSGNLTEMVVINLQQGKLLKVVSMEHTFKA